MFQDANITCLKKNQDGHNTPLETNKQAGKIIFISIQ
jgi:hypothetical protein